MNMAADAPAVPLEGIPNVTVIPYDVVGNSSKAVRRSIDAVRPTDPNDGKRVDGLSRWNYRYKWRCDGQGKVTTTLDDIVFSAEVKIPRLADDGASSKLREQFDHYLQTLLAHEDGHVRYAWDSRDEILAAISSATCATAKVAAQAAVDEIKAHDVEYDTITGHGRTTIAPLH
jgi:predicted secreted Zn-dependent protease